MSDYPNSRWGISALSKSTDNVGIAYNEEIMVDKSTGEFLIKTKEGDVASYSAVSRLKSHIDIATQIAYSKNVYGEMYLVEEDTTYPKVLTDGILIADTTSLEKNCRKVMLSIDMDNLIVNTDGFTNKRIDPKVHFSVDVTYMGTDGVEQTNTIDITGELSKINSSVINVGGDNVQTVSEVKISSINILTDELDPSYIYRHILNNIIIIVE